MLTVNVAPSGTLDYSHDPSSEHTLSLPPKAVKTVVPGGSSLEKVRQEVPEALGDGDNYVPGHVAIEADFWG